MKTSSKAFAKKTPSKKEVSTVRTKKHGAQKSNKKPQIRGGIIVLAIVNMVAFFGVVVVNYLAVNLPLGGMTTGALSDLYPSLFTPAPLTFSIWGLIYLALFGFVIWQIVDLFKKNSLGITKKVGIRFLLSCLANVGWIFARHYQKVFLSMIIMILFLIILILITNKIQIGKKLGTWRDKMLVQIPFSIYIGRISVATIANIAVWLVHIQRNMWGMTPIFRTMFVIIVATLLALIALRKTYNIIFAWVIIRAFIGIIIKTLGAEVVYGQLIRLLGACIAVISAGIGWKFEEWKNN